MIQQNELSLRQNIRWKVYPFLPSWEKKKNRSLLLTPKGYIETPTSTYVHIYKVLR